KNPQQIGLSSKVIKRQCRIPAGRMDLLLLQDTNRNLIVVELKLRKIGHDAVSQIQKYMNSLKGTQKSKRISGIIVCQGVLPTFEKEFKKLKNIKIFCYGWQLKMRHCKGV
ncbi:MAG: endonuclease NucS domain-containing protein, partial [Sedimentisphaerales bacterium]